MHDYDREGHIAGGIAALLVCVASAAISAVNTVESVTTDGVVFWLLATTAFTCLSLVYCHILNSLRRA